MYFIKSNSEYRRPARLALAGALLTGILGAQPYAYVTNISGNSVSVVNTASNTVSTVIPVCSGPTGVAVSPDGTRVYAACQSGAAVSVIDASSNSVIDTIAVGGSPSQLAVRPDNSQVYVVIPAADQIAVIDAASRSVVGRIGVGSRPSSVAFDPSGSRAFVSNLWSSNVSVIDTASRSVVNTFAAGSGPSDVEVSPDGNTVYVSNQYANSVSAHSAASGAQIGVVSGLVGPNSITLALGGRRLFVTNGNGGGATAIDASALSSLATCGTGSLPTSVAASADGSRVYVTNQYSFSLSVIDAASNAVIGTVNRVGVYPVGVALRPGTSDSTPTPTPTPTPVPPPCSFSLSNTSTSIPAAGGWASVGVTTSPGCAWSATSNGWWAAVANASGSSSGTVSINVSPNTSTSGRSAIITIAGQQFTINQAGFVAAFSPIRVNCGGPAIVDQLGIQWAGDEQRSRSTTMNPISGTPTPGLYQTEAYATGPLTYQFTVPNGTYSVKLKFAEIYLTLRGRRIFDIVINGATVYPSFDILALTSPNSAVDQIFNVNVVDGQITITLNPVTGSPKVNAIEIN